VATRSTKHNKLFQPITDKKALGVGFGGSVQMRRREGLLYLAFVLFENTLNVNKTSLREPLIRYISSIISMYFKCCF